MAFKPGDKVKYLNDVGGGVVIRTDNKTVYLRNDDGFEMPALVSQLLKVETMDEVTPFTETVRPERSIETIIPSPAATFDFMDLSEETGESNIDPNVKVLLAWIADIRKNGKITYNLYLINDCGYHIMYVAAMVSQGAYRGVQSGILERESSIRLAEIEAENLKDISKIRIETLFFKKGAFMPQDPMHYELVIDDLYIADKLNYESNEYFDEKALFFNITEEYLLGEIENVAREVQAQFEKQKKQIDQSPAKPIVKKTNNDQLEEVDLHIEQLVDNPKVLSPAEMLETQMARFQIALEGAIKSKQKRIVFIHGVGNGRLRLEICRTLDQKYPRLRYQDASFKEYGYGATMVIL